MDLLLFDLEAGVNAQDKPCCISDCPAPADSFEDGHAGRWVVRLFYCHEHAREREQGIPMGGLGVDGSRVEFTPEETSLPLPAGTYQAISPH